MTIATAPLNVLVVDDEPAIRRFLRLSFDAEGYQVGEAGDGRSALEALRKGRPDILMLTHKFILDEVWDGATDVQYLRVYIRTLRKKIEADPDRPILILTEPGVGYRLREAD